MTDLDRVGATAVLLGIRLGTPMPAPRPGPVASYDEASADDGLALQLSVLESLVADGASLGGWKIGWTSRGARDQMGEGFRPFGFVLADRVLDSGAEIELSAIPDCRIEAEVGVIMGTDLAGPDVTVDQAKKAVAAVVPAFEICTRTLPDGSSAAIRLGNGLNNWGIVVGSGKPTELRLDTLHVSLSRDGEEVDAGGTGPEILDDPYLSLTRVCQTLDRFGRGLAAGESLITGSTLPPVRVSGPGYYVADFGELGVVSATFR